MRDLPRFMLSKLTYVSLLVLNTGAHLSISV